MKGSGNPLTGTTVGNITQPSEVRRAFDAVK